MKTLEFLEPLEIAAILKFKPPTVYEMLHTGEIPAVVIRCGKRKKTYRIYKDAFENWLEKNRTKPPR